MNALDYSKQRYTCKAYDSNKKIDPRTFAMLLECLRLAPSSINIQPWQYLIATSDRAKAHIASAMQGQNAHNIPKVLQASHILVFCGYRTLDETHLAKVLLDEKAVGRLADDESFANRKALCQFYLQQYANQPSQLFAWIKEQLFIALGHFLLCAEMAGVQATAISGFNPDVLDNELALADKNLGSVIVVALGYASDQDFNRHLHKSRLAFQNIFYNLDDDYDDTNQL